MTIIDLAGWVAPAATVIAAMMTAASLGARLTGWGFVVFTAGSITWSVIAVETGQDSLLVTNGFLTLVNIVGIWRWLGRQARYEDGSKRAAERSHGRRVPSLFAASQLAGMALVTRAGERVGTLVDAMSECDSKQIAYIVVRISDVGEALRAVHPDRIKLASEKATTSLTAAELLALPEIGDRWPASLADHAVA